MSFEVIMPKLGLTMTHGKVTRWQKKEGDLVHAGEVVLEIETDKINSEVESPVDGYILKILVEEGEDREITTPLCIIGGKDESLMVPLVRETRITPVARKMAQENGIDIKKISGSGPDGRIVKEDIQALIDAVGKLQTGTDEMQVKTVSEAPVLKAPLISDAAEMVPLSADRIVSRKIPLAGVRKIVAQRLTQSKHDIPHVYFKIIVDAGNIMELKNRMSQVVKTKTGRKLSLNDIIVKAAAAAIEDFPDINASLVGDEIIYYESVNIGIAINSERGLVVPVMKNAHKKSLSEICKGLGELVDKARSGKLNFEHMSGGTFTVSNLGAYYIDEFSAIINPPESAILAIGRATETPCVRNGEIVISPLMNLTLSVDHRVIDGALAAQFLKRLKDILEDPYLMLM